jgi:spore maturation protein CgeB
MNNVTYLSKKLDNVRFINYGYNILENDSILDNNLRKKYDLVFIGSMDGIDGRRRIILDSLKERYVVYPEHENLWGEKKTNAIKLSKICLNIHFDHSASFESNRIYDYFGMGAFVLSEYIGNSYPFLSGEHYIKFNLKNLTRVIDYYLSNDEERISIAKKAQQLALTLPVENSHEIIHDLVRIEIEDKQINKFLFRILFHVYKLLKYLKIPI